jgi:hypothetical protein
MGSGWKLVVVLVLLAALAAIFWDRQRAADEGTPVRGAQPRVVTPEGSARPGRERPGREREERPGGATK